MPANPQYTREDAHRLKTIRIAPELLIEMMKSGESFRFDPLLPKDAELRGVFSDHKTGLICFHVFSSEYPIAYYQIGCLDYKDLPRLKYGGDDHGVDLESSWGLRVLVKPKEDGRRILLQEENQDEMGTRNNDGEATDPEA